MRDWFRDSRRVWLIVLTVVIVICAEAIAVPTKRSDLLCATVGVVAVGFDVTRRQRQRRERTALASRLAAPSSDDIPADVIELIVADRKIQAIKRYRDHTGAGLRDAKAVIDSVGPR